MEPLYKRILGLFHGETAGRMTELRAAIERADRQEICRISHTIKGAAGNVCALSLSAGAERLEREAPAASAEKLRELAGILDEEWRRLDEAVKQGGPHHGG